MTIIVCKCCTDRVIADFGVETETDKDNIIEVLNRYSLNVKVGKALFQNEEGFLVCAKHLIKGPDINAET